MVDSIRYMNRFFWQKKQKFQVGNLSHIVGQERPLSQCVTFHLRRKNKSFRKLVQAEVRVDTMDLRLEKCHVFKEDKEQRNWRKN